MAAKQDISIPAAYFTTGALPPICAKTGLQTDEKQSVTAVRNNPWAVLGFFLLGIVGLIIALYATRKTLDGAVPREPDPDKVAKRRYIGLGVAAVSGLFLLTLTADSDVALLSLFGFIGIFVAGFIIVGASSSIKVRAELSKDQQTVTLKDVHPMFADATRVFLTNSMSNGPVPPGMPYQFAPAGMAAAGWTGVPAPGRSDPATPPPQPLPAAPGYQPDPFSS